MTTKPRKLKVREVGDFYLKKTKPEIKLCGNWLRDLGIKPGAYVTVEQHEDGILLKIDTPK